MTAHVFGTFAWFELRTLELDAAARFYHAVFGWSVAGSMFTREGQPVAELGVLPERARALGAPAHWLPHLRVADLDATLGRWTALGGAPLGPPRTGPDGTVAGVRDPLGAPLAFTTRPHTTPAGVVAFQTLLTTDSARALAAYAELFGWRDTGAVTLPPPVGVFQLFAWAGAGGSVGGMTDAAAHSPTTHVHWEIYFAVDDVEAACARVRAAGGQAEAPVRTPGGDPIAACHDPQGAAFTLRTGQASPPTHG